MQRKKNSIEIKGNRNATHIHLNPTSRYIPLERQDTNRHSLCPKQLISPTKSPTEAFESGYEGMTDERRASGKEVRRSFEDTSKGR